MKIINEKGKLFGFINIVDLLVIVFLLAVIGGVAWKIFGNRISESVEAASAARNGTDITYTVRVSGLRPNVAQEMLEMDYPQQLAINTGLVPNCYITQVTAEPTTILSVDKNEAWMVEYDRVDLIFTIEGRVEKGDFITVGSQEVRLGKSHIVKSQFLEASGVIESVQYTREDFTQG